MSAKLQDLARRGAWERFEKELERTCGPCSPYPTGSWVIVEQRGGKATERIVGRVKGGNHLWLYLEEASCVQGYVDLDDSFAFYGEGSISSIAVNRDQILRVVLCKGEPSWAERELSENSC